MSNRRHHRVESLLINSHYPVTTTTVFIMHHSIDTPEMSSAELVLKLVKLTQKNIITECHSGKSH
jgi:hypothetical protein